VLPLSRPFVLPTSKCSSPTFQTFVLQLSKPFVLTPTRRSWFHSPDRSCSLSPCRSCSHPPDFGFLTLLSQYTSIALTAWTN
jgi:hypothetical protein